MTFGISADNRRFSTSIPSSILRLLSAPVTIPFWDYRAEYAAERTEIHAAIDRVLESGRLILADSVRAFEQEFAAYAGVREGIGVNSGTDALMLALRALDIGPGDEVITTANTAIPTVSAIVSAGAIPRFVDIDPRTCLMDVTRVEAAITPRTRGIIPVHLFGQCVDMDALQAVAARHGLAVLEDCAQATGARYRDRTAGSMSQAAAFSFYPTKVLGAYGDGGMVVTSDARLADRVRRLRVYGTVGKYYAEEHGYNSRLDELHAEMLRVKLRRIEHYIARRRELAGRYDAALRHAAVTGLATPEGNFHVYHLYVVRHPARDTVLKALEARGVGTGIHYPWPIHLMPGYAHLGYPEGSLPETERAAREIFSLPLYPSMTDSDHSRVCEAVRAVA